MQTRCAFTIPGRPQRWIRPQQDGRRGSARNARFTDPKAQAHKDMVAKLAARHFHQLQPWTGPVVVSLVAVFAIPPSWPKHLQRAAREARVMHISDPDLDQLVKQVWDGVKGVVVVDDNQFCGFAMPTAKRYGHPERTEVVFSLLQQDEDAITPGQRRLEKLAEQGAFIRP
jgi:Holliday junction resolvase RusA-like endonuclease